MPSISPLLCATAILFLAGTSAFAIPPSAPASGDISFAVFFNPGAAALSKEGRQIISVAARRFVATHNRHSAARIIVTSEADDQDSASLSNERIQAVSNQLVRDGVQRKLVSADDHPGVHNQAVRLEEWLDRRVSINIQDEPVVGRL